MKITAIVGEVGRFLVESQSNPDGQHLVDLLEGQCGCADYVCRRRKYEQQTGRKYRCRHLRATREYFLDEIIEHMKEHAPTK